MSGAVAGLIGSVKAASGPTNIVNNGSATSSSDLANYYGAVRNIAIFNTTPASWSVLYDLGSEQSAFEFLKSSSLTVGTAYSLSFWARNGFTGQTISVSLNVGNTNSIINVTPTITGWTYYKIENVTCTVSRTLDLIITANDLFYLDDIWVIAGPTAY